MSTRISCLFFHKGGTELQSSDRSLARSQTRLKARRASPAAGRPFLEKANGLPFSEAGSPARRMRRGEAARWRWGEQHTAGKTRPEGGKMKRPPISGPSIWESLVPPA